MRTSTPRNLPIGKDHPRMSAIVCAASQGCYRRRRLTITKNARNCRHLPLPFALRSAWDEDPSHQRRLRETLFNILAPRIAGSRFVDLYAGTGAVGIEALSRGAAHVWFAENAEPALASLRQNLAALRISRDFTLEDRGVGACCNGLANCRSRSISFISIRRMRPRSEYADTLNFFGSASVAGQDTLPEALVIAEHSSKAKLAERYGVLEAYPVVEAGRCGAQLFFSWGGVKPPP